MAIPKEVIETWLDNNRRALAGYIVHGDVEYTLRGEKRFFHNVLAPIRIEEAIVGTLGVNLDLTDQRRTVLALRESEEKLRMAVDAAGVGLWSWDPATDEVVWDARMSAIFGRAIGAAPVGRDAYLALVHPGDRELVAARLAEGIGSARWGDEYRVVRGDGQVRWLMTQKTVVRDGERPRVLGAVIDVTERRARDDQIRQAQKLEAVGQLAAGIAHNFNNMLMGVIPNLDLAIRRAAPDVAALLEGASDSAGKAADLVKRLMTYAGRNRAAARAVEDAALVVARTVALCRAMVDRRITFEETYEAGAGVHMDATQIEQAVLNLLINARDALDGAGVAGIAAPRVAVSVALVAAGAPELGGREGDHARVRVADNGEGMDAATLARIYEPFFTTKPAGRGTGLGLATAHAIVREHGGFIECASEPGRGTTFSLYLPSRPLERAPRAAPASRPAQRGTETVLVVDDEPRVRQVAAIVLRSAGYTVREASSGSEALELLSRPEVAGEVALVLLDVSLPGPPRVELRRRLRELTRARVVYFTGYALDAADA
ncbi:MAG: hybrid sensor histidine kinase/response regulator, partial [Polyangiaceae bacterium]